MLGTHPEETVSRLAKIFDLTHREPVFNSYGSDLDRTLRESWLVASRGISPEEDDDKQDNLA